MSGGIAYVLDRGRHRSPSAATSTWSTLEHLEDDDEIELVRELIARHVELTDSAVGERVLQSWATMQRQFVAVMPRDFKRVKAPRPRRADPRTSIQRLVA